MTRPASRHAWSAVLLLLCALAAGGVRAQTAAPHGGAASSDQIADVPSGPATLRGRVAHRGRDDAGADLTVALFALATDGRPGVRRVQSGPTGEFVFDGISNDPTTVYLLGVRFDDIPFSARFAFEPGQTDRTTRIEIFDARSGSDDVAVGDVELRIDRGCSGARISESHTLRNPSDFVLFVPADERADRAPIARVPLPSGAIQFESIGNALEESVDIQDGEVRYWGPLHPGTQPLRFVYSLPSADGRVVVTRAFPSGAADVRVLTFGDGPAAHGEALRPAATVAVGELSYTAVASGPVAAGDSVAFSLDLAGFEANADRLETRAATIWLELDDAALDVREQFEFVVTGDTELRSNSDAPLVCLPLPPGTEEMRFSSDAFAMGIQPDPTGGLALRGPIPAGRSGFAMSYLLRNGGDRMRFERSFPTGLPVLSLYVADTGVLTETDRFHRRRPVRTSDRTYLHLEAFQVDPNEAVAVELTSLPLAQPLPRAASAGFVIVAALVAGLLLTAPMRSPAHVGEAEAVIPATAAERAAVYAAIRDLEDDFETGKISADDHTAMLAELRAQAGALLQAERTAATAPAAAAPEATARTCSGCGAAAQAEARFCSQCGAALAGTADDGNPTA